MTGRKLLPIIIVSLLMVVAIAVYPQGPAGAITFSLNGAPLDGAVFLLLCTGMVYGAKKLYDPE